MLSGGEVQEETDTTHVCTAQYVAKSGANTLSLAQIQDATKTMVN